MEQERQLQTARQSSLAQGNALLEHQARDRENQTLSTVCFMVIAAPFC